MIIHPAGKRRQIIRPAVLVDEGRARSLDDGKVHDLKSLPEGLRVYSPWDLADELATAGVGEMVAWGEEPIRWRHERKGDAALRRSDAVIVKVACDTRREFEHGIAAWADWLLRHEVNPGWSLGGTSMGLLRATLTQPLVTTLGELPPSRWTLGGRQQCFVEPGTVVRGAVQLDLPAAYTHVVGGLRYGGAWRKAGDGWTLWPQNGYPALARADVRLPADLTVGPLHRRPSHRPDSRVEEIAPSNWNLYPTSGRMSGLWTYDELEQAANVGVKMRIREAYVHCGGDTVFADWHDAIMEGRALPGFAGQLAKATGNALWGQFVIDDRKRLTVQRWNGTYKALAVQSSRGHQVRAWDVGEIVCGTVRAKLYEMLSAYANDLICCHTDGVWIRDTVEGGDKQLREWRLKSDAAELHVLDQQKYRYAERKGYDPSGRRAPVFKTIFSGVPAARADEVFQRLWAQHA